MIVDMGLRYMIMVYLGRLPSVEEVEKVYKEADEKRKRIIKREGDSNGLRLTDLYLSQIVAEKIIEKENEKKYGGIVNA